MFEFVPVLGDPYRDGELVCAGDLARRGPRAGAERHAAQVVVGPLFGVTRLGHAIPERRHGDLQPFTSDAPRKPVPSVELPDSGLIRTEMALGVDLSPVPGHDGGGRARRGGASGLADPYQRCPGTIGSIDERCAGCASGQA